MSDYDPTKLEEAQEEAGKLSKKLADQERDDLNWILSDARGRRFVNRLLAQTGVYRNPFTGNSQTYFKCGEMNIGQWVVAQVQSVSMNSYTKLLQEHINNGR